MGFALLVASRGSSVGCPQLCPLGQNPFVKSFRPALERFVGKIFLGEDAAAPADCLLLASVCGPGFRVSP